MERSESLETFVALSYQHQQNIIYIYTLLYTWTDTFLVSASTRSHQLQHFNNLCARMHTPNIAIKLILKHPTPPTHKPTHIFTPTQRYQCAPENIILNPLGCPPIQPPAAVQPSHERIHAPHRKALTATNHRWLYGADKSISVAAFTPQ